MAALIQGLLADLGWFMFHHPSKMVHSHNWSFSTGKKNIFQKQNNEFHSNYYQNIKNLKLCIHERAAYSLCHLCVVCKRGKVNYFSANLRRAKDTWCMERTPGASSSLCVRAKNRQILVCGECYANRSRMAQRRFAVRSTNTRI